MTNQTILEVYNGWHIRRLEKVQWEPWPPVLLVAEKEIDGTVYMKTAGGVNITDALLKLKVRL